MEKTRTSSTSKAFFMCMLACLVGGIVFGIVYYIGYYFYYLSILELFFGVLAFLKYKQDTSKKAITLSMILSIFFVILFNFAGIFLCETIIISTEYDLPFNDSFKMLIDFWQTEPEIAEYFTTRILQIVAMTLIGCVFALIFVLNKIKNDKQKALSVNQNENTQATNTINATTNEFTLQNSNKQSNNSILNTTQNIEQQAKINAQNIYFEYYAQCKMFVNQYTNSKDMATFKQNVNELKQSANNLENDIKEQVYSIIKTEMANSSQELESKVLQVLSRIFN